MLVAGTSILSILILLTISVSSTRNGVNTPQVVPRHLSLALEMPIITSIPPVYGCAFLSLFQCIWKYHPRYVSSLKPTTSNGCNTSFKCILLNFCTWEFILSNFCAWISNCFHDCFHNIIISIVISQLQNPIFKNIFGKVYERGNLLGKG